LIERDIQAQKVQRKLNGKREKERGTETSSNELLLSEKSKR